MNPQKFVPETNNPAAIANSETNNPPAIEKPPAINNPKLEFWNI